MLSTGIIIHCNNTQDLSEVSLELADELGYVSTQQATVAGHYGLYIKCNPTVADLATISGICFRRQVNLKVTVNNKLLAVRHAQGVPAMTVFGTIYKTQHGGVNTTIVTVNQEAYGVFISQTVAEIIGGTRWIT